MSMIRFYTYNNYDYFELVNINSEFWWQRVTGVYPAEAFFLPRIGPDTFLEKFKEGDMDAN